MILVDAEWLAARRPDRALFEDLSVTVRSGDRLGVVGRNGTGKSTLLRVLAGDVEPDSGAVRRGRGARTSFLPQRPSLVGASVREAAGGGWEAEAILDRLGMGSLLDASTSTLSGGQAKRVALARALLAECDLLVLDEPTNHLDLEAIAWLEKRLASFPGGLVMVTHDRHVLDRVTTRMIELERGQGYVHDGGYQSYLEARAARAEREATAETVRRNLARDELAWLRRGAKARSRKPKARIAAATAVVEGRTRAPERAEPLDLAIGGAPRLGGKVVELHGVGHRFGEAPWLFEGLNLSLDPRGRLGVVGPNGSGKSTLLEIVASRLPPAAGSVEVGTTVRTGYYDQTGGHLDPAKRVRDVVAGKAAQPGWQQLRLMERFWFDDDAQWAQVGTLSGGEQRRLQLLLVLAESPNLLLLDEPTNDLDLDTLRALEDYLESWEGSLVVVSHDRALLERTVEDALVLDGAGGAQLSPGGYAGYEELLRSAGESSKPRSPTGAPRPGRVGADPDGERATATGVATPGRNRRDGDRKGRSPSTLRRLIAETERQMESSSADVGQLEAQIAQVASDHLALSEVTAALAEAHRRLADAEQRWLELWEELG
ncbi:MAG: ABC-F family ATP-binding cassette domain-containing protein [Actinomycetota bacterium]|nr:ABC-F family ATP-binding cassette domain-containing protein [Actinomycetota bacterium]